MTKWADSLIRISNHEVETLQKRLADIVERRQAAEMKVATLDAEGEAEAACRPRATSRPAGT
jgi:flagellar FliJ protein